MCGLPVLHTLTDTGAARQGSQEIAKLRIVHLGIRGPRNGRRGGLPWCGEVTEVMFVTHTSATDGVFDPADQNKILDSPAVALPVRIVAPFGWMLE
jgi:hypothetical protein